ncbi:hypothetical protein DCAR_0101731 [Daucus carota subsp. sativus]|uniref:Uncharacterized protein n=1 Tax=Daucus carota subsp. sativus TaxID=79200 RepID=A0A166GLM5_DAUCS|nr:hypothetical protein DCAR_0101731 [Daucus carota subsp. sativus]
MPEENSFVGMKGFLVESVIEVGIDYDGDRNAKLYRLFHPLISGRMCQTIFDKNFKNQRDADTRSIYFFELERLIDILQDDHIVSTKTMKPILDYYDLKRKQYEEVYGDRRFHDDSDYLSPKEENQVGEKPEEVIDLIADDEDEQPHQPPQRNPPET